MARAAVTASRYIGNATLSRAYRNASHGLSNTEEWEGSPIGQGVVPKGVNDVIIPRSQYMGKRNNRRK